MFKKYRQLLIGIIIGAVIFSGFYVVAEQVYDVLPNHFTIKVDGTEKKIEGYNINGYSYFKLRDIGEQVGFNVDFKEETILIETQNEVRIETSNYNSDLPQKTPDDLSVKTINNKAYVHIVDIDMKWREKGYMVHENTDNEPHTCVLFLNDKRDENGLTTSESVLYTYKYESPELRWLIDYDTYVNEIMPLLPED